MSDTERLSERMQRTTSASAAGYANEVAALETRIKELEALIASHADNIKYGQGAAADAYRYHKWFVTLRDVTIPAFVNALREAPMPQRESTLDDNEWEEKYDLWWHKNASEVAIATIREWWHKGRRGKVE